MFKMFNSFISKVLHHFLIKYRHIIWSMKSRKRSKLYKNLVKKLAIFIYLVLLVLITKQPMSEIIKRLVNQYLQEKYKRNKENVSKNKDTSKTKTKIYVFWVTWCHASVSFYLQRISQNVT